jgi:predicted glycoside hydrolase/deacetylase ChbG (UPF0249 family)
MTFSMDLAAQDAGRIRLVVRGDDMGMAHSVNVATIDSYRNGIMRTIEVMAPTPWFPEAVAMLKENPGLDVGVHLVLTSEWETLKWRPLTHVPSLVDEDGYFFPMIWPGRAYGPDRALREQEWKLEEIEQELRAQIELAKKHIPQVSHVTSHMGFTGMDERVGALVKRLAVEYGLDIDLRELGVESVSYDGPKRTPEEKIESFIRMLEKLEPGKTYMFLDHPAYDTPEMETVGHVGYTDVGLDREGVTRTFTDPRVKETIERLGIEVISYADLKK